jgi:hypothetical protein
VQTSPGSRHGYFLLDQPLPAATVRELARRAAYGLGGDRSGWDSQQLVRVPGTWNTKTRHGGHFFVTLQWGTKHNYTADELFSAWPEPTATANDCGTLDWPAVEYWLGNLAALVGSNGLPRRVKPTTQTGRVLRASLDDTSLSRYIVAKGLALHGYPDAEIGALLWHYCDYDKSSLKGSAWLKADIQRVIGKVRAERPDLVVNSTRVRDGQPAQPIAERTPARRGRVATLTPATLLRWYEGHLSVANAVLLTVAQVAEQLGVSRATIERCERVLRAEGQIERHTFNRRQASLVMLLRPGTTSKDSLPVAANDTRDTAVRPRTMPALAAIGGASGGDADPHPTKILAAEDIAAANNADRGPCTMPVVAQIPSLAPVQRNDQGALTKRKTAPFHVPSAERATEHQEAPNIAGFAHGGTHAPQGLPTPRLAVAEAFEHFAGRQRISRQMVVMFLDSKYPTLSLGPHALDRLIAAERTRRKMARQIERLRQLRPAALTALSRRIERILIEGSARSPGKQYAWASALYPDVCAEQERRSAIRDRVDPQRLRGAQREYLALAARALRAGNAMRTSAPPKAGPQRGVCSPTKLLTQHELFVETGETAGIVGLVTRLKRLKQEREAAMGGEGHA